ncbi:MAG: hypothetical protein ACM3KF_01465 [Acidobacteriota bacterium]
MEKSDQERINEIIDVKIPQLQLDATRQLTESINRIVASSMPELKHTSELMSSISKTLVPTIDGLSTPAFSNLAKTMTEALSPTINSVFLDATKGHANFLQDIVKPLNDMWAERFSEITKNLGKIVEWSHPPNWRGDKTLLLPENLETLLLDEGLPLAWVPARNVLDKMFAADTVNERRKILYNNRKGIINSCLLELNSLKKEELHEYKIFAIEAAESIKMGHWRSSQALSTNIIDSVIRRLFDNDSRLKLTNHRNGQRISWKEYPLRAALVFGGVWGSYAEYWPDGVSENIPRQYTRHATAHAVSKKQYTNINSLIAVMHLTAFLKLIDEDL